MLRARTRLSPEILGGEEEDDSPSEEPGEHEPVDKEDDDGRLNQEPQVIQLHPPGQPPENLSPENEQDQE